MPKAFKSCPKFKKSPDLVTLLVMLPTWDCLPLCDIVFRNENFAVSNFYTNVSFFDNSVNQIHFRSCPLILFSGETTVLVQLIRGHLNYVYQVSGYQNRWTLTEAFVINKYICLFKQICCLYMLFICCSMMFI